MRSKNIKKLKSDIQDYRLVFVEWNDAQSDAAWGDKEDVDKWGTELYIVNEVGWIICETSSHLVIGSEIGSDGTIGNRTKIPKQWIKTTKYLRFKNERPTTRNKRNSTGRPSTDKRRISPEGKTTKNIRFEK